MFKIKQKLDNIYDLLINFNNNERKHTKATEDLMRSYEKSNVELTKELESVQKILKTKEEELTNISAMSNGYYLENQRLTKLLEEKEKESQKHSEFVRRTTERLLENQEKKLNQKKPTLVDLKTEKMYKISDETKAKLK